MDSNQDGKLQVAELQSHAAFDQNEDGTVSVDEAKFFLHMEEEMDKSEFLVTGWPLLKPFIMKEQAKFKPPTEPVAEEPSPAQPGDSQPQEA